MVLPDDEFVDDVAPWLQRQLPAQLYGLRLVSTKQVVSGNAGCPPFTGSHSVF